MNDLKKKRRYVGKSSMVDPKRGLWEGPNFNEVPQFLISNRISLAFGLASNKDQTCMNESCFMFLLYRGICRFCAIFGRFGGMAASCPFGFAFESHGSPPLVNMHMYVYSTPTIRIGGIFLDGCIRLVARSSVPLGHHDLQKRSKLLPIIGPVPGHPG